MVSSVTKKWSHFSTESMFDLTETVLNVSSWAAGITPLFLFLLRVVTQVSHAGHEYKPFYQQSNLSHQLSSIE